MADFDFTQLKGRMAQVGKGGHVELSDLERNALIDSAMEGGGEVDTDKIVDGAVTAPKIADSSITTEKLADKQYQPIVFSGMGQKYLKKNVVGGQNILTSAMVSEANTIYHIQYDYDLNGQTLTIPNGAILQFEGGSIYNGVINGNKMPTENVYTPEMFGAGKTADDTQAIQNALNICKKIEMDGIYHVSSGSAVITAEHPYTNTCNSIPSNTDLKIKGTILLTTSNLQTYAIFSISDANNIIISGNGTIVGDKSTNTQTTGEWGMGIAIRSSNNIKIEGLEIKECFGDGVCVRYPSPYCEKITIDNVIIHDCRRQGISVVAGDKITISNFRIYNIQGTLPEGAIDVENETGVDYGIGDVSIINGVISNCGQGIICNNSAKLAKSVRVENVTTDSKIISGKNSQISSCVGTNTYIDARYNAVISGCDFGYLYYEKDSTDYGSKVLSSHFNGLIVTNNASVSSEISGCSFDIYNYDDEGHYDMRALYATSSNANISLVSTSLIVHNSGHYYSCSHLKFKNCNVSLLSTYGTFGSIFEDCMISLTGVTSTGYIYGYNTSPSYYYNCRFYIPNATSSSKLFRLYETGATINIPNCVVFSEIESPRTQFQGTTDLSKLNDTATIYLKQSGTEEYSPFSPRWNNVNVQSGTTSIIAENNSTYYIDGTVGRLTINLPDPELSRGQGIRFDFTTSSHPIISFISSQNVLCSQDYSILASTSYEISAVSNGHNWVVSQSVLERMKDSDLLCMEVIEGGTITLTIPADVTTSYLTEVSYKIGIEGSWVTTANTSSEVIITTPTLSVGDTVFWKGSGTGTSKSTTAASNFSMTAKVNLSGNIMSMLSDEYFVGASMTKTYAFCGLFKSCKIVSAEELTLPTQLKAGCFYSMFSSCSTLTTPPKLPATILQGECYTNMFMSCSALTTSPVLPALTLESSCYTNMFRACSSLNYVTALFTTEPSTTYTNNWLNGVASTGTFVKNSSAEWDVSGVSGVPSNWTVITNNT